MSGLIGHFLRDRRGATAIEYGVIVSLVAVAIISALSATGCQLNTKFARISSALN